MMITSINGSRDLAALLNDSEPLTEQDAAETPRDWLAGLWVGGDIYPLDPGSTTETRAVLADGTAAITWKKAGQDCWGSDNPCAHASGRPGLRALAHWIPAELSEWTCRHAACGVTRDWRRVTVWDANGFSDATVHATVEEARDAAQHQIGELTEMCAEHHTDDES
jgi:hypothetical protein